MLKEDLKYHYDLLKGLLEESEKGNNENLNLFFELEQRRKLLNELDIVQITEKNNERINEFFNIVYEIENEVVLNDKLCFQLEVSKIERESLRKNLFIKLKSLFTIFNFNELDSIELQIKSQGLLLEDSDKRLMSYYKKLYTMQDLFEYTKGYMDNFTICYSERYLHEEEHLIKSIKNRNELISETIYLANFANTFLNLLSENEKASILAGIEETNIALDPKYRDLDLKKAIDYVMIIWDKKEYDFKSDMLEEIVRTIIKPNEKTIER